MVQKLSGPLSYQNWKMNVSGEPWDITLEYPLFSDANFTSKEIITGFGPFQLINNIHMSSTRPAIILRIQEYLQTDLPHTNKNQDENYHGGYKADEIAALLSLCLGVRMKAGGANRAFGRNGNPMGIPVDYSWSNEDPMPPAKASRPILIKASGDHSLENANILSDFPSLSSKNAATLIRAARLYQEAVWIIDSTPELSWLMLTSAVETVAQEWGKKGSPVERLNEYKPELITTLRKHAKEGQENQLILEVAQNISGVVGATAKFVNFILEFLPAPPSIRPNELAQLSWDKSHIKEVMSKVYNYRSKALHTGKPFPLRMCQPPMINGNNAMGEEIPIGLASDKETPLANDMPILLHTFEYIARNAILNWWERTAKGVKI